ncbi:MAG: hypothetical protein ABL921_32115 [Pirellula sp.]
MNKRPDDDNSSNGNSNDEHTAIEPEKVGQSSLRRPVVVVILPFVLILTCLLVFQWMRPSAGVSSPYFILFPTAILFATCLATVWIAHRMLSRQDAKLEDMDPQLFRRMRSLRLWNNAFCMGCTLLVSAAIWGIGRDSILYVVAVPMIATQFIFTVAFHYRSHAKLRPGQFSLGGLLLLMLIVGFVLTRLLAILPKNPNRGPLPLAKSTTLEVFELKKRGDTDDDVLMIHDDSTNREIALHRNPVLTSADILEVEWVGRITTRQRQLGLTFTTTPNVANILAQPATATPRKFCVLVVNGNVVAKTLLVPLQGRKWNLFGGLQQGEEIFNELTAETIRQ